MGVIAYLDTVLVPMSLFLTVGYHAYLWHNLKNKPSRTTIGINMLKRRAWFLELDGVNLRSLLQAVLCLAFIPHSFFVCHSPVGKSGDDKKGMLAVQSLRNTLMGTTLTATVAILFQVSLAALINNSYSATHLFSNTFFGSQSTKIFALKYGSAALSLSVCFLCSSMAIAFFIDANFLINACDQEFSSSGHARTILEKGFILALVSNRMLCITFPMLLWMLGPVPVWLSSLAMVWGLYGLDFPGKFNKSNKQSLS